ncbi:MAG TPA: multicopper oxidase domain-containing protein [Alphaproteobacteria bacterium]|nr:multicopper oxidase domain-containing protein [Alphaproteobacteria bacterium]
MKLPRRRLLQLGAAAPLIPIAQPARAQMPEHAHAGPPTPPPVGKADYEIRIANGLVELGEDVSVSTKLYNGQFPGPLVRLKEGRPVTVDIHNDTDTPEQLHWHGQFLPPEVDGAAEEGTPFIPAHGMRRIAFTPGPSGFRFYHTHLVAGADLSLGLYNGQAGPVYIEPKREPGAYDREVFLTLKEFGPVFSKTEMPLDILEPRGEVADLRRMSEAALKASLDKGLPAGYELAYSWFAINGRMLGHGDRIKVKPGERVLFHVLNASATEIRSLALPGHIFKVIALDGNPVPTQARAEALWIGTAERVSAIVEMNNPGIWVMGDIIDEDRNRGMGIVVEYAGATGAPLWKKPDRARWNYAAFGKQGAETRAPDETIDLLIGTNPGAANGFDQFTINGVPFAMDKMDPLVRLKRGGRYRLRMRNATDDIHPMHLHRHSFELSSLNGMKTSGVMKDVVMLGKFQTAEVDFTADQPGLSLFHCHMQQHMDFGLMCLFECV